METYKVERYHQENRAEWNTFVMKCMQQHFFFTRDFIEYHKDRFIDYSLIIRNQTNQIVALFPATLNEGVVSSHAGLTFGGLLYKPRTFVQKIIDILSEIERYCLVHDVQKIIYKVTPYIYKTEQGEEDVYALFKNSWQLIRRDLSGVIKIDRQIAADRSRRKNERIALSNDIEIKACDDFEAFWTMLNENLTNRHNVTPTHSLEELIYLKSLFPDQIKLIGGFKGGKMMSGTLLFLTPNVCKVQYSVNSIEGRKYKVLDAVFMQMIRDCEKEYIDFGHSCEEDGKYLNEGLARFKYQFSGESLVNDFYLKELK
ncbi:hypothetical protein MY04_3474 [Flammeovirga sp. MY04]|uniref:hypothetical protein n=1 Tax=Flammeovirga sp. MY04 TaxID=1191459 RepID=UPI000806332F|nr:hypothetical protein [Flammeovirga sp. MY04]ANQ50827.1 hypothetical protein MY04_3474 [Flammeovirga sp. MY04]